MKLTRHISLFIALLSVLNITAQQQQSQNALYNYRNDGDFNAWLNIDVDSITYSNIGIDSIEYDNIVTQEVWTPDSLYRIPLAAIDSIAFRAPEPEFKKGIFHITEEHVPYAIDIDSLCVTFDSSIPISLLPVVGQVIINDVYDEPFEEGFAGRVVNITYVDGMVRIECEEVGLDEVYEQLICVGKTIVYDDDDDLYSSRRKSPRKIKFNEDGTIELPLGKFSLDILTYKEIDQFTEQPTGNKTNYVKLTAKPSLVIDYAIKFNVKGQEDVFKFVLGNKCDLELDMKWPKSVKLVDWEKYLNTFIPIPTGVPGLYSKICFGGYLKIEGDVRLEAKIPFSFQNNIGYDSQNDNFGGIVYNFQGTKLGMPELSASLNASISGGLAVKYVTCIVAEKLASTNLKVKTGPKLSGKLEISTNGYTEGNWSWYESMKDSKVTLEPLTVTVSGGINIFGKKKDWKYTLPIPDYIDFLKKRELYLVPLFTKPEYQKGANAITAMLKTEPSRNLLLPVKLGMSFYEGSSKLETKYLSPTYRFQEEWPLNGVQVAYNNMMAGKTYTAYPAIKIMGIELRATPSTEFPDVSVPVEITQFEMTKAYYYPNHYTYNDKQYSFKYNCTAYVTLWDNTNVVDWGYVYIDPYGSVSPPISLKQYSGTVGDPRYAYCRNEPTGTVKLRGYVKYKDDNETYYGEVQEFPIEYPTDSSISMTNCTFQGTTSNASYQGETYKYKSTYRYLFTASGAYWLKVGTDETGSGWNNWSNLPDYTTSPVDGANALTVNYYYNDKTFAGDYNVHLKATDESHSVTHTTSEYVTYTHSGNQFTGCTYYSGRSNARSPQNDMGGFLNEDEDEYNIVINKPIY